MSTWAKVGLVLGGYAAAFAAACFAVYLQVLFTQDATSQASSGMLAFGDLLLWIGVFGLLSLFPTALAGYFLLRRLFA